MYPVHLALDEGIDLRVTGLLLPHEAEGVPVCLQRAGGTQPVLSLPQKPVEEGVEDVDRDGFEGGHRILLGVITVPGGVDQTPVDAPWTVKGDLLIPNPLDQAEHVFAARLVDSLGEFSDVQVLFQSLVVFRRMFQRVCHDCPKLLRGRVAHGVNVQSIRLRCRVRKVVV